MSFAVSTKHCWYDDANIIVKMYFLNDIPFTFDDLPDGHLYDKDLVDEANGNAQYEMDDIYKGSQYLILEQASLFRFNRNIKSREFARRYSDFL